MSDSPSAAARPLITLVVPTYNGKRHLEALFDSIKRQSLRSFEVLVVDDFSSDGTLEYLRGLAEPGWRLVRNERNLGLYATLNRCLAMVETEFGAMVFQDDELADDYVEELSKRLAGRTDGSFFFANSLKIDESGTVLASPDATGKEFPGSSGMRQWRRILKLGTSWIISGSVMRVSACRDLQFREDLPHCSDYEFMLRVSPDTPFIFFDRNLVRIREHTAQASTGNLATSIDIMERIQIFREQRMRHPGEFDWSLRADLLGRYGWQILRRAAGQLRRGNARHSLVTLRLAPKLYAALFDRAAA